jgi:hypothetical protein
MKPRLALAAAALFTIIPAIASSETGETAPLRRWGVGWDSGVAARYFVKPNWGVGIRFYPSVDNDETKSSATRIEDIGQPSTDDHGGDGKERSEDVDWTVGVIGFMDFKVTGGFKAGPFVTIARGYSSATYETDDSSWDLINPEIIRTSSHRRTTYVYDSWTAGVGIRPSLVIRERILLEARFGVNLAFTDREYERNEEYTREDPAPRRTETIHSKEHTDSWDLRAIGQDQPVYVTLQMILLF